MNLAMAIVRSGYLAFIVGYTLSVAQLGKMVTGAPMVAIEDLKGLLTACWLAIAWIAFEVALSWARLWLDARARRKTAATAAPSAPRAP